MIFHIPLVRSSRLASECQCNVYNIGRVELFNFMLQNIDGVDATYNYVTRKLNEKLFSIFLDSIFNTLQIKILTLCVQSCIENYSKTLRSEIMKFK